MNIVKTPQPQHFVNCIVRLAYAFQNVSSLDIKHGKRHMKIVPSSFLLYWGHCSTESEFKMCSHLWNLADLSLLYTNDNFNDNDSNI